MRWQVLVAIVIIEIIYLIGGGLIFWAIENSALTAEEAQDGYPNISSIITDFIGNGSFGNLSEADVLSLFNQVSTAIERQDSINQTINNWGVAGSIFFAMTVVTTIGYGNLVPTSGGSMTFCCFYALVGIPLTLVMLFAIGEKLNSAAGKLERRIIENRPRIGKAMRSLCIFILGFGFFVLLPSGIFTMIEGWTYGISIYYSIITLSTIGFGDYVAGFNCIGSSACGFYRISVGIWIYIGLAWLSSLISSLQDAFKEIVLRVDSNPVADKIKRKINTEMNDTELVESGNEERRSERRISSKICPERISQSSETSSTTQKQNLIQFSGDSQPTNQDRFPSCEYKDLTKQKYDPNLSDSEDLIAITLPIVTLRKCDTIESSQDDNTDMAPGDVHL